MKKLISIVLLLILPFITFVFKSDAKEDVTVSAGEGDYSLILCGFDEAAENTDSIILAKYISADNSLNFIQIPRDTYHDAASYKKINSLYPSRRASGDDRTDALKALEMDIEENLGINIDASIGYTMDTFVSVIDAIGGVDLDLPKAFSIYDSKGNEILSLSDGENHIDGKDALLFVRARNGYTGGDISRIDAQKIFLSSFLGKIKNDVSLTDIIKGCVETRNGWTLNVKIGDLFKIIMKNKGRISNVDMKYATLPGVAALGNNGVSYFYLSHKSSIELLNSLGFQSDHFDPNSVFLNNDDKTSRDVYYQDIGYYIYDDKTLSEIDLSSR